jgi:hypothetical protein
MVAWVVVRMRLDPALLVLVEAQGLQLATLRPQAAPVLLGKVTQEETLRLHPMEVLIQMGVEVVAQVV